MANDYTEIAASTVLTAPGLVINEMQFAAGRIHGEAQAIPRAAAGLGAA